MARVYQILKANASDPEVIDLAEYQAGEELRLAGVRPSRSLNGEDVTSRWRTHSGPTFGRVALRGRQVVGFCVALRSGEYNLVPTDDIAIYVTPTARRSRIGTELFRVYAQSDFVGGRETKVTAEIHQDNAAGQAFLHSLGFDNLPDGGEFYRQIVAGGPEHPAIMAPYACMEKTLEEVAL